MYVCMYVCIWDTECKQYGEAIYVWLFTDQSLALVRKSQCVSFAKKKLVSVSQCQWCSYITIYMPIGVLIFLDDGF